MKRQPEALHTSVLFPQPSPQIDALLEHRRGLGLDRYDEMHEGTYVVSRAPHPRHGRILIRLVRILAPLVDEAGLAFSDATNVGDADDYRVPDAVVYQPALESASPYLASAALVIEILSPAEQTNAKFAFTGPGGCGRSWWSTATPRRRPCTT